MDTQFTSARSLGDWQRLLTRLIADSQALREQVLAAARPVEAAVETVTGSSSIQVQRNNQLHGALHQLNALNVLILAMETQLTEHLQAYGVTTYRLKEESFRAMADVLQRLLAIPVTEGAANKLQEAVALYNSYRSSGLNEQVQADRTRLREQIFPLPTIDDELREVMRQELKRIELELDRLEGLRLNELVIRYECLAIPTGLMPLLQEYGVSPLPESPIAEGELDDNSPQTDTTAPA